MARRAFGVLTAVLAVLLSPAAASAANTCVWSGTTSAWETASNWTGCGGTTPQAADTASIPAGTANAPTLSSSVSITSLTVNGGATLTIANGGALALANGGSVQGSINDNGTLTLSAGTLIVATLTGSAQLTVGTGGVLSMVNAAQISGPLSGALVVDSAGSVMHSGAGTGMLGIFVVNGGTVQAASGGLTLSDGFQLAGTFEAIGSGALTLAAGNSAMGLTGNSTVRTSGSGTVSLGANTAVDLGGHTLGIDGTFTVPAGQISGDGTIGVANDAASGTLALSGTGSLGQAGNLTLGTSLLLDVTGDAGAAGTRAITNHGTVRVEAGGKFDGVGDAALTNAPDGQIVNQGVGVAKVSFLGGLTNNGYLIGQGGELEVDGLLTNYSSGTLTGGTYWAPAGGTLRLPNTPITGLGNQAKLDERGNGQVIDSTGNDAVSSLTSIGPGGILDLYSRDEAVNGGLSNAGTIDLLSDGTSAPTKLTDIGNFTQTSTGTLLVTVTDTQLGELLDQAGVSLGGTLIVAPTAAYSAIAKHGDSFGAIHYTSARAGKFATVQTVPALSGNLAFTATYDDSSKVVNMTVQAPPANTKLPAITGAATEGKPLAVSNGVWTDNPSAYAYQWQRCVGSTCVNIQGATGAGYSPIAADVKHRLRVVVAATNTAGFGSAISALSPVIAPITPKLTQVKLTPTSFKAKQGSKLRLQLSVPAQVLAVITYTVPGHKVAGGCQRSAKHGKACRVTVKKSGPAFRGRAGVNAFTFAPKLAPRSYTLVLVAVGATGGQSKSVSIAFTIRK